MISLEHYLHQTIEVNFWEEDVQKHIVYEGRLVDIDWENECIILKLDKEMLVLDLKNIENIRFEGKITSFF